MIDDLIKCHQLKIHRSRMTTLFSQNKPKKESKSVRRVLMNFVPEIMRKLEPIFRQDNMSIVYSNSRQLNNLLDSTKDKVDPLQKSGIYEIECGDCHQKYIGQTSRKLIERFKEYMSHVRYNRPQKSSVADHILSNNVSIDNLSLKKQTNKPSQLDAFESFFIQTGTQTMNADNGNITFPLFHLV